MEILLSTFSALFSVVNPFGAMPVFLTLTQEDTPQRRSQMAMRASMYSVLILAVFFFAGQYVLNFFGLRIHDLRIAGGIMLLKAGFDLLTTKSEPGKKVSKEVVEEGIHKDDISFTPLAMPMLAGPGAIAVSIGMFTRSLSYLNMAITVGAIILVAIASYFILVSSHRLTPVMGKAGLAALSKIMGFITLSIGANFITSALIALFK